MSLFATYIDDQSPKIIFDTDVLDILGTYEASINLRDEHDNISQYILIVEITSEAEIKPIDNSFPYFDEEELAEGENSPVVPGGGLGLGVHHVLDSLVECVGGVMATVCPHPLKLENN